jgi:hypothetical protein
MIHLTNAHAASLSRIAGRSAVSGMTARNSLLPNAQIETPYRRDSA